MPKMRCEAKVSFLKTDPNRSRCDRGGKLYSVSGALTQLQMVLCAKHARRVRCAGLTVDPATELEKMGHKNRAA